VNFPTLTAAKERKIRQLLSPASKTGWHVPLLAEFQLQIDEGTHSVSNSEADEGSWRDPAKVGKDRCRALWKSISWNSTCLPRSKIADIFDHGGIF
jgi:hypothetical protein